MIISKSNGMKKIGIVGCGAIGSEIARAIIKKEIPAQLTALYDLDSVRLATLQKKFRPKVKKVTLKKLVQISDIVVEAAGRGAVRQIVEECIRKKKTLMVMSAGYFITDPDLLKKALKKKCRIILPPGALAGLDALKAACAGGVDSVTLTTTKPPLGLLGAPYFNDHPVDLGKLVKPTVIFEGNALDAVKGFPANINVSALLSIAGIGPKQTRVRIIADPAGTKNIHEIEIQGRSGRITTRTENVPSPSNPKTSYLAVLSAISTLQDLCNGVKS